MNARLTIPETRQTNEQMSIVQNDILHGNELYTKKHKSYIHTP